jgi:undecaprenyl diphosphate synthase
MNDLSKENHPRHVAIIMDGNGRWAKKQGKKRMFGHEKGAEVAEKIIEYASNSGVRYLTLYTFSTENWKRPEEEVNFLFKLFIKYLESRMKKIISKGVRMRFSGRIDKMPEDIQIACKRIEEKSKNNNKLDLIMALNYGARQEITDAVNKLVSEEKKEITKEDIKNNLYLPDVPDVDLLIRTSGEKRISNFLLWQIAYSELYFTDVLWPDFDEKEFDKALSEYARRERRFGGLIGSDEFGSK